MGELVRRRGPPGDDGLWNAGGFDQGSDGQAVDAYEYGLALLLDGIAADAAAEIVKRDR